LQALPVILLALAVNFTLVRLAPGDPVYILAGDGGSEAYYSEMRARFGLDRPLPEQFIRYVANAADGDLGYSYTYGQPVLSVILERVPATLLLMLAAQGIAIGVGVPLGVLAATKGRSVLGAGIRTGASLGYTLPVFWVGQLLVLVFAYRLGLFPTFGMESARAGYVGVSRLLDVLHHLVLPALALSLVELGMLLRITDASVHGVFGEDFIRTARAKGLGYRVVLWRHVVRNALLPVVTVIGNRVGVLLTGAVLVEIVFAWPGLGRLVYGATLARDYPLLLATFLVSAVGVVLANLVTDLLYALLDPRVEYR
jgi:peptide/nickel transport system permease protein